MKKLLAIGCFLALIYGCGSTNEEDLVRNITQGQLIGVVANNNTYAWKGIPFCLLYTSPSPRDGLLSRMPSSA